MDSSMVQQVISWVEENVGERTSKAELMQKAQGSSLPAEAKSVFQDLPEGQHSKQSVIQQLQSTLMAGVGGMGGGLGQSGGRGSQGGSMGGTFGGYE